MPDLLTLVLFVSATLVLVIPPGPAVLYIVARSIDQGRLAGIVATLGISTGTLFHIAAAAFGVSALLMSSVLLFNALKYLGAAYLVYLGVSKFLEREAAVGPEIRQSPHLGQVYRQGIVVNLLNPKTSLFFFAFLPQFVDVGQGAVAVQILLLGALFVAIACICDGLWAVLAGTVRPWIRGNTRYLKVQRVLTGCIYVGLGLVTALTGAPERHSPAPS